MFSTFQVDIMINVVIDATYKANGHKCKLTYAQNPIPKLFNPICWAYTKNGPYTKYLDEQYDNNNLYLGFSI